MKYTPQYLRTGPCLRHATFSHEQNDPLEGIHVPLLQLDNIFHPLLYPRDAPLLRWGLASRAVAMYHLQTPLLVAGVCVFILFLTRFCAARQAVWKLQKANVVSNIAFKGPRKMTRLMRRKSIVNARIQAHCRSLPRA
jgi:hypothetical protein